MHGHARSRAAARKSHLRETASTRKTQAAPGTKIQNRFLHEGRTVYETYEVQPDHTYKLIRRSMVDSLGD